MTVRTLRRVVIAAAARSGGAAAISVSSDTGLYVLAASDHWAATAVDAETVAGHGPSLAALTSAASEHIPDLAHESRWPGFVDRALSLAVTAVDAVPIGDTAFGPPLGVLSIYHHAHAARRRDADTTLHDLVRHATHILIDEPLTDILNTGPAADDRISIATGILSHRFDITTDQAHALLRARAYSSGRSLTDLATTIISGHND